MKKFDILSGILLLSIGNTVCAQGEFDLLQIPARTSGIANTSIITNITKQQDKILAVGERGHILSWSDMDNWQQQSVPVSLTLTDSTTLKDGTRFAVGHDSVILKSAPQSDSWTKVFDGNELTKLKIIYIGKKIDAFQERLEELTDEDEIDELHEFHQCHQFHQFHQVHQCFQPSPKLMKLMKWMNFIKFINFINFINFGVGLDNTTISEILPQ